MDPRDDLAAGFAASLGDVLTMLVAGFVALALFFYVLLRLVTKNRGGRGSATSDLGGGDTDWTFVVDADGD